MTFEAKCFRKSGPSIFAIECSPNECSVATNGASTDGEAPKHDGLKADGTLAAQYYRRRRTV